VASLPFVRSDRAGRPNKREINRATNLRRTTMFKTLFLAVALIAASAAAVPAMAFVNLYATNPDAKSH